MSRSNRENSGGLGRAELVDLLPQPLLDLAPAAGGVRLWAVPAGVVGVGSSSGCVTEECTKNGHKANSSGSAGKS